MDTNEQDYTDKDFVMGAVMAQMEDLSLPQQLEVTRDVLAGLLADQADAPLEVEVIDSHFYNSHQSWWLKRTVRVGGRRYQIEIRRNAYDDQSYAKCSTWTDAGWSVVVTRPITDCEAAATSYVTRDASPAPFYRDADALLRAAVEVAS